MRALAFLLCAAACGDDSAATTPDANDPTTVAFGTTAIVVVVNPIVNDANAKSVPSPGPSRTDVVLTTDDNVTATTGANGIAVLAPVTPGMRTITVSGAATGTFTVAVASSTLREVALATDTNRAELMVNVDYKADQAMEVDASMTNTQVNDILAVSDRVVFFKGGTYVGDLDFGGSRVTLFGEGVLGGKVSIEGNVVVSGSDSRIRGADITGNLTIPASKVGISFSRVSGATMSAGSDGMLLANALCGAESITGSGTIVLGNAGAAPSTSCP
jgi:hypothetical protein